MSVKPSDGVGLSEELHGVYLGLSEGNQLRRMVDRMADQLMENCFSGNQISHDRIPTYYVNKYGVNNLYRYRLSGGYRGIYTILVQDGKINCWILELLDHAEYNRRFGYSTSF